LKGGVEKEKSQNQGTSPKENEHVGNLLKKKGPDGRAKPELGSWGEGGQNRIQSGGTKTNGGVIPTRGVSKGPKRA